LAPRFGRVAAALLGRPAVRLYQDVVWFHEPGSTPSRWHQDCFLMPFRSEDVITMWMPLADVASGRPTLEFILGEPDRGRCLDSGPGTVSVHPLRVPVGTSGAADASQPSGHEAAGDATFHSATVLHCVAAN